MLFAVVGAIWTISILCMTFATVYFFHLHRNTLERYRNVDLSYAWDKYRLSMLYTLGLAVFYLGTARLTSTLSGLILNQLNQRPIPLWYPDRWLTLAAICAVLAFMIGLLNRGEYVEDPYGEIALDDEYMLPAIRSLPTPVIRPEDSTTYLKSVTSPLVPVNILDQEPIDGDGFWAGLQSGAVPALLTTLGVCIVAVIGWLLFSQTGVFDGNGRADSTIALAESSQSIRLDGDSTLQNVDTSIAIPARPTEDPSNAIGRSTLSTPANTEPAANSESTIIEPALEPVGPESVEPILAATETFTSSIPITLVSSAPPEQQNEPVAELPAAPAPQTPASKIPVMVVQGAYSVNARLSPTVDSAIILVLPSGSTLPVQEWSPNGEWILVLLDDGRSAWVAAWVVEVINPTL